MKSVNQTGIPRCALLNDISCLGKCSVTVSLPILAVCGIEGVALPTVLLSTHTGGFDRPALLDLTDEMKAFAAHWQLLDVSFDAIYTGFFGDLSQPEIGRQFLATFKGPSTRVLVDPVLGDNGALYPCFCSAQVTAMRRLCAEADVITPNLTEAALLTDSPQDTPAEELLQRLPYKNVIITGVISGENIGYLARLGHQRLSVWKPRLPLQLHGAGDVFASALCAGMMALPGDLQALLPLALQKAADFCDACIRATAQRQPAHWYGLAIEDVLKEGSFL